MEKLLPKSSLLLPKDAVPMLAEEKGKEDSIIKVPRPAYASTVPEEQNQTDTVNAEKEAPRSTAEEYMSPAPACSALGSSATGERLLVFQDPPESCDRVDVPKRKRKRNFLNLKKGSVAPTIHP